MENEKKLISKTKAKSEYGLTDSWIKRLGEPDKQAVNPRYASAPKMSLFSRHRIEIMIDDNKEEWEELQVKRMKRSEIAQGVADRKRAETIQFVNSVEVIIGHLPKRLKTLCNIVQTAGDQFIFYERNRYDDDFILSPNAVRSHVRHVRTNYEDILANIQGRVGKSDAYFLARERVDPIVELEIEEQYGRDWSKFKEEYSDTNS